MLLRQNHSVGGIIEIPNERMKTVHSYPISECSQQNHFEKFRTNVYECY